MPVIDISNLDDPRLDLYRNLKDRDLARLGHRFIAESEFVVRRLLASSFVTESVVVAEKKRETMRPAVPENIPLYVLPDRLLDGVIGYKFHTGVIAVGRRNAAESPADSPLLRQPRSVIVACPDLNNVENLGSIVRICAGLGVAGLLLGPECCDPFYRLGIRVSMGTVFSLPIFRSIDFVADLLLLKTLGYRTFATVLDAEATPLPTVEVPEKSVILFGNESAGLTKIYADLCDERVTIPMHHRTDSLNVSVAAGIFLYRFCGATNPPGVIAGG